jgi:hypothetical protein
MEINVSPSPDYEVRASEQDLMEAFRQLLERGRKIRLAGLASSSAATNTNQDDPGSACANE